MSDAISLQGVGKRYTLFASRLDMVLDALSLSWLRPRRRREGRQFWALRSINLALPRGSRVGIIGRNGAGKSTLLKLITGNIDPTEGAVAVHGEVQALLQAGTGMHPDFTGYQNIEAALTYQGLTPEEIRAAVADIADFTELGPFLDQPFKSYSTGMQARLAFAAATVVKPDILIIDELLGVGDGYFLSKSTERIQKLIDTGATVLLVSHSTEQITRFCEQAVWLERGQIVRQGDVLEVVKEYERFLRVLDERRIKAGNRQALTGAGRQGHGSALTDSLVVRFEVPPSSRLYIGEITLAESERPQQTLHVGGPQDAAPGHDAVLRLAGGTWSQPECVQDRMCRQLGNTAQSASAEAEFSLLFDAAATYAFDVEYRLDGAPARIHVLRDGSELATASLPPSAQWRHLRVPFAGAQSPASQATDAKPNAENLLHWPGLGGLRIERIRMLGADGQEQVSFPFAGDMTVEVLLRAELDGTYPLRLGLTIYRRSDGVCVTQQLGQPGELVLGAGQQVTARLHLSPLLLGNGVYVFSMVLFRHLDLAEVDPPERYDLVDRSLEFQVHGRQPGRRGVFQHPGEWALECSEPLARKSA